MSTNGLNITDDGEMAECEGEKVVTMMDVLQEQQDFEDDANAVLGASDEKNCTYSKGYIKRQAIYACLTCCGEARMDPDKRAGVCLACSLSCHENHELVVELYTKRNFRCDCGNPKLNHPCQFNLDKTELNTENLYNQNFSGLYCVCSRPYPDPEATFEDEMIQCIVCEDWLHASHLQATVPGNDQYSEMICKSCMEKNDFLHDYSEFVINIEDRDVEVVNGSIEDLPNVPDTEKLVNGDTVCVTDNATDGEMKVDEEQKENLNLSTNVNHNEVKNNETNKEIENEICDKTESNDNIGSTYSEECDTIKKDKETEETVISMETKQNEFEEHESHVCIESANTGRRDIQESEINDVAAKEFNENNTDSTDTNIKEFTPLEQPKIAESEDIVDQVEAKVNEIDENNTTTLEKCADDIQTENWDMKETDMQENLSEHDNLALSTKNDEVNFDKCADDLQTENEDMKETDMQENISENDKLAISTKNDEVNFDKCADDLQTENDNIKETDIQENLPENDNVAEEESNDVPTGQIDSKQLEGDTLEKATEELSKLASEDSENIQIQYSDTNKDDKEMTELETFDNSTNHTTSPTNNEDITHIELQVSTEHPDNKRKLEDVPEEPAKKPRLDGCTRPNSKKVYKGATFWPINFRQKLCTCSECLTMYRDLSVMFLIDPEDTVTAYEALGKERIDGTSVSQYEKGLEALSSLDRVQQINALTEYNKMKDKLLDFLKSFKDRKEVVKEEDIRAFFADMKPRREPDGVYFCR
ncbi:hypothetical protein K1T71_009034 [Dendrolimus kikuchii]|uniref:Uncharacterized protein n=1 Tax=Dendrolimus kikuchii TaxID=765133 RepID=A0ACC1CW49_9NEOP|nr:hypothetical protein K1T71_009034 [Dendrolimus kikuchii]